MLNQILGWTIDPGERRKGLRRLDGLHRGCELIAPARDGDNATSAIGERLAQGENVLGEVAFFDKTLRPDGFQQLVFGDHAARVRNKEGQDFKCFGRNRDRDAIAEKYPLRRVQLELVESIYATEQE